MSTGSRKRVRPLTIRTRTVLEIQVLNYFSASDVTVYLSLFPYRNHTKYILTTHDRKVAGSSLAFAHNLLH
jgi:hypothetical protein